MKIFKCIIPVFLLLLSVFTYGQSKEISRKTFFADERKLEVKLTSDIKNLLAEKKSLNDVDATISCKFPDSSIIVENIKLKQRGHFRKDNCYLSSLMLQFNKNATNKLAPLKNLKLVGGCGKSSDDEQYLFKEYLTYKIFNLLTDYSFRVRLLQVTYEDSKGKFKTYTQHAFLLEDIDDVAKRNNYRQKKLVRFSPKGTHSYQTTLVSVFEYMIGNTDWSIPYYHNIKLVVPKEDTFAVPLPIPYDFDITGLVNPSYATTPPDLGIENVSQRVYRGFAASMEVTEAVVDLILKKEKDILAVINEFDLLSQRNKKDMINFLADFFKNIKNKSDVKSIFITNARTQ